MTTQDTITIPRELGPWLIALIKAAHAAASHSRYTPAAAIGEIEKAIAATLDPDPGPAGRTEALEGRCTQLVGQRDEALDAGLALRQEMNAADVRASEAAADQRDALEISETKAAALASRVQALRAERTELESDLRTSREANAAITTENSHTRRLLREATNHIESMAAAGIDADADKLGADLAARSANAGESASEQVPEGSIEDGARAWLDECLPGECLSYGYTDTDAGIVLSMSRDRRPLVTPLTPATTPKQNEGF